MILRHLLLALVLVLTGLAGYVAGQVRSAVPLADGPVVYSGENFGFRATGKVGDPAGEGPGWMTGSFVIQVDGQWVEARLGTGVMPITSRE